jgi:hypothetical protein
MTLLTTAFSQGLHSARPAASASNKGYYYFETDTGNLFQNFSGSLWVQVATTSAGGTVTSVSSGDSSIAVTNPTTTPSLQMATMDVQFTNNAPAGSLAMNSHKLTGLAAGSANGDSLRFEQLGLPVGLTGATAATRYAGATASGAPASGTFAVGDFVIDQTGKLYICTVAGTPGTWTQTGGSSPLTTKGDIFGHSTVDARIPVGSDGQVVTAASAQSLGVAYQYPPGYEIGYDQVTAGGTISSTTEASPTTIIACSAHTFDGGPVLLNVFIPQIATASANFTIVTLFEASTELGRLALISPPSGVVQTPVTLQYRFTPSAASHTYTVGAICGSGTAGWTAGAGGTATNLPAFARFTKV